jgi:uncharacterized protein
MNCPTILYLANDKPFYCMKKFVFLFFGVLIAATICGQSLQKIIASKPGKLVSDFTNTLTADQQAALEEKLYKFDDSTSSHVAVVIINSTEGADVADVATEIGRSWGVGSKKNNNGVVLLIAKQDRKMNISVGYGLEKALPDLVTQQIIQNDIRPYFKGNDYYGGINRGTNAIIAAIRGEYKAPEGYNNRRQEGIPLSTIIFIIVVVIVLLSMFRGGGGGRGGTFMSRRGYGPIFFPTGGFGGGGGGGWGGGGSSGGGFGGFGGGSFGGGGSSGDW